MGDKQIKLIVTDLDGTLLDHNKKVCQENYEALKAAYDRGVKIALCSGRPPHDASIIALDAGLDMYILGLNGCCCMEHPLGEIWRHHTIPNELVRKLLAIAEPTGLVTGVFSKNRLILNCLHSVYPDPRTVWGSNLLDPRAGFILTFDNEGLDAAFDHGVNKMMIHDPWFTDDRLARLMETYKHEIPELEFISSWPQNIEINPGDMNKGESVRRTAQALGLTMDEVMVLGDYDNDVTMLEAAGTAVAMGNSTPAVLAAATHVTVDYRQAGLAKAVRKLVLREDVPCVRSLGN